MLEAGASHLHPESQPYRSGLAVGKEALKVLQICSSRSWGGMEMHMPILCEKLRERGHEVLPVCYEGSPIDKELRRRGFEPTGLNLRGYLHPIGAWRL